MIEIKKNFPEYSFLFVAFAWGWVSLYGNAMSFLLILLLILNICRSRRVFWDNLKEEKYYLGIPLAFLLYMLLHTVIVRLTGSYEGMKASYGIFETILLYFIAIPCYILSMKPWMNVKLLVKALGLFCWGILFFNVCFFFKLTGGGIFTHPLETLNAVYLLRFGGNKEVWGSMLMLEPQAMVLALASIIAFFLLLIKTTVRMGILTLFLILFLSFTVTKAAILSFLLGGIVACLYIFKRMAPRPRKITLLTIVLLGVLTVIFVPQGIVVRVQEAVVGIQNIQEGNLTGGSLETRIAMWGEAYKHFNEYALEGVGVYYKPVLEGWFTTSANPFIAMYTNIHNSFLEYWIRGGLPGLLLIVSLFAFPLYRMCRSRRWSLMVVAIIIVIFVASNTCVLFVHTNSLGIIMFVLAASCLYSRQFALSEKDS